MGAMHAGSSTDRRLQSDTLKKAHWVMRVDSEERILPILNTTAITSYPERYEINTTTKGGMNIFIRPIKPEDGRLVVDLFRSLSRQSLWFRFLSTVKELSPEMMLRLTQIDHEQNAGLVALESTKQGEGKLLGICHVFRQSCPRWAEFSVVVGDPWQGKGVGARFLECCVGIAKERGIESLSGLVTAQNTNMLALAAKFGATIRRIPESNEYEVRIDVRALH